MATKRQKIASLLKRFQFIDLSQAVSAKGADREQFLREYVGREGVFASYEPFRKSVNGIYGVQLGLDPSPASDWPKLEMAIRNLCKGKDEAMNLEAAQSLFDFLREQDFNAYGHQERSLRLGADRSVSMRIEHYLVRGSEAIFQFPYPRRTRLSDDQFQVMASLMHFGYVIGDFSSASVEIVDLSPIEAQVRVDGRLERATRSPRLLSFDKADILDRETLQAEVQDIYDILMKIAEEP